MLAIRCEGCFNHWSLYILYQICKTFSLFLTPYCWKTSGNCYPYNFMRREYQENFFELILKSEKAIVPILKPDQNSVCCLLLNYVSLKHKCVGFRKLQINYFHMTWENVILTNFVWGEKILFALFYNTREL